MGENGLGEPRAGVKEKLPHAVWQAAKSVQASLLSFILLHLATPGLSVNNPELPQVSPCVAQILRGLYSSSQYPPLPSFTVYYPQMLYYLKNCIPCK